MQEYREALWDKQIEADAKAGYRAGKATPFARWAPRLIRRST
jgi:hypothetical protein